MIIIIIYLLFITCCNSWFRLLKYCRLVKYRIYQKLLNISKENYTPVIYGTKDIIESHAGKRAIGCFIHYPLKSGIYSYHPKQRIMIRNDHKGNIIVLAHEIGHLLSISETNNRSETAADIRGKALLYSIMTGFEKVLFKFYVEINMRGTGSVFLI